MTTQQFLSLVWQGPGAPVLEPPFPSPLLADPTFLFPAETPDGLWHLFAHTAFGVSEFTSPDGLSWSSGRQVAANGMRPFVRRVGDEYVLLYEQYPPLALVFQALPRRPRWHSRLVLRRSPDLKRWSKPQVLIKPDFSWAVDAVRGEAVSNPCLVRVGATWRLWFSASLVTVPDCGFDEPRYIGLATASSLDGPWTVEPAPRLAPENDAQAGTLGEGSMKVLELDDGWIALQNKIYTDANGQSRSALFVLRSADGLAFVPAKAEPLLSPAPGWTSSHVYACDIRLENNVAYLYFNARDGWRVSAGKERVGRLVGLLPGEIQSFDQK